jgi:hypothetical protein
MLNNQIVTLYSDFLFFILMGKILYLIIVPELSAFFSQGSLASEYMSIYPRNSLTLTSFS